MKHLLVLGLMLSPIALSACQARSSQQEMAETRETTLNLTGMT